MSEKIQRKQHVFVIRQLVSREIKRKYARSYLGVLWSVLNPLLNMVVISMIFSQIFRRSIENYPIYFLTGSILWNFFTGATNACMTAIVDNKNLLMKVRYPMSVFILSRAYSALVNLGYSMIAYVTMVFVFQIQITWTALFYPVIIFFLFIFGLGFSYMLATLYVFFGDIKHLYSVILTLWMYCSALFYSAEDLTGNVRVFVENNPIYIFIKSARLVVIQGELPSQSDICKMVVWSLVAFLLGYQVFRMNKNKIMQNI